MLEYLRWRSILSCTWETNNWDDERERERFPHVEILVFPSSMASYHRGGKWKNFETVHELCVFLLWCRRVVCWGSSTKVGQESLQSSFRTQRRSPRALQVPLLRRCTYQSYLFGVRVLVGVRKYTCAVIRVRDATVILVVFKGYRLKFSRFALEHIPVVTFHRYDTVRRR